MLSIITPTYNRANELKRVYKSLLQQSNYNFEWIIVDDGSSDDTKNVVQKFLTKKLLKIKYFYKKNGGKPSAYNLGVEKAKGQILICLDSDDLLVNEAVEIILQDYEKIKNDDNIAGLVYNCCDLENKMIGTSLPNDTIDTYFNIYEKYKVKGDKLQVIKTKVAREYPFPIINNEKFVPEALINNRISLKYKFLYCDSILKEVEYLDDGLSNNYFNLVKRNPLSNALYFKELYDMQRRSLYNVYGYVLFCIYGKVSFKDMLKEHKAKLKIILLYLPVLIISKLK